MGVCAVHFLQLMSPLTDWTSEKEWGKHHAGAQIPSSCINSSTVQYRRQANRLSKQFSEPDGRSLIHGSLGSHRGNDWCLWKCWRSLSTVWRCIYLSSVKWDLSNPRQNVKYRHALQCGSRSRKKHYQEDVKLSSHSSSIMSYKEGILKLHPFEKNVGQTGELHPGERDKDRRVCISRQIEKTLIFHTQHSV